MRSRSSRSDLADASSPLYVRSCSFASFSLSSSQMYAWFSIEIASSFSSTSRRSSVNSSTLSISSLLSSISFSRLSFRSSLLLGLPSVPSPSGAPPPSAAAASASPPSAMVPPFSEFSISCFSRCVRFSSISIDSAELTFSRLSLSIRPSSSAFSSAYRFSRCSSSDFSASQLCSTRVSSVLSARHFSSFSSSSIESIWLAMRPLSPRSPSSPTSVVGCPASDCSSVRVRFKSSLRSFFCSSSSCMAVAWFWHVSSSISMRFCSSGPTGLPVPSYALPALSGARSSTSASRCTSRAFSSVSFATVSCTLEVFLNVSTCFWSCLIFSLHLIMFLFDSSSCCRSLAASVSSSSSADRGNSGFGPLVFSFSCSTDTFAVITFSSIVFSSSDWRSSSICWFMRSASSSCAASACSSVSIFASASCSCCAFVSSEKGASAESSQSNLLCSSPTSSGSGALSSSSKRFTSRDSAPSCSSIMRSFSCSSSSSDVTLRSSISSLFRLTWACRTLSSNLVSSSSNCSSLSCCSCCTGVELVTLAPTVISASRNKWLLTERHNLSGGSPNDRSAAISARPVLDRPTSVCWVASSLCLISITFSSISRWLDSRSAIFSRFCSICCRSSEHFSMPYDSERPRGKAALRGSGRTSTEPARSGTPWSMVASDCELALLALPARFRREVVTFVLKCVSRWAMFFTFSWAVACFMSFTTSVWRMISRSALILACRREML
uniref:Uncharacterized protein n=1 Tax=Anopheles merus TaxID=30066 RepID=A0A182VF46_ANOME